MGFQKTKNCRDKKKRQEAKEKKKVADRLRYLSKIGNKVAILDLSIKESQDQIRKKPSYK